MTEPERSAIKDALTDIGDLYLYAGTAGGYATEGPKDTARQQAYGRAARQQAALLGIRV